MSNYINQPNEFGTFQPYELKLNNKVDNKTHNTPELPPSNTND